MPTCTATSAQSPSALADSGTTYIKVYQTLVLKQMNPPEEVEGMLCSDSAPKILLATVETGYKVTAYKVKSVMKSLF